jgi:hypothetical protein
VGEGIRDVRKEKEEERDQKLEEGRREGLKEGRQEGLEKEDRRD